MADAKITFSHTRVKPDLTVSVNPDQITWAYGLNTMSYPTYGGEVVQILSVYWDDMTISGTVGTVAEMETIYTWFLQYLQTATQRGNGESRFDQHPVQLDYPARDWHFQLWPKALPGFRYGRDVIAPTWTLIAAIKEPDASLAEQLKDLAVFNAAHKGDIAFGKTTADFGSTGDLSKNPYASPDANPTIKGSFSDWLQSESSNLGDTFSGFVADYQSANLSAIPQFSDISQPAKHADTGQKHKKAKNKKGPKGKK